MGFCSYQFNASELYRRTKPGQAPEVTCGARTFPAVDEPEVAVVRTGMGSDGAIYEYRPTGRHIARPTDDPHCPAHGGSPEPPPPPVSLDQLQAMYDAYAELYARYEAEAAPFELRPGVPYELPAGVQPAGRHAAPALPGSPVSYDEVRQAAEEIRTAADRFLVGEQDAEVIP